LRLRCTPSTSSDSRRASQLVISLWAVLAEEYSWCSTWEMLQREIEQKMQAVLCMTLRAASHAADSAKQDWPPLMAELSVRGQLR
jgi:hypothetical protein